jgi:hypothetical protein
VSSGSVEGFRRDQIVRCETVDELVRVSRCNDCSLSCIVSGTDLGFVAIPVDASVLTLCLEVFQIAG